MDRVTDKVSGGQGMPTNATGMSGLSRCSTPPPGLDSRPAGGTTVSPRRIPVLKRWPYHHDHTTPLILPQDIPALTTDYVQALCAHTDTTEDKSACQDDDQRDNKADCQVPTVDKDDVLAKGELNEDDMLSKGELNEDDMLTKGGLNEDDMLTKGELNEDDMLTKGELNEDKMITKSHHLEGEYHTGNQQHDKQVGIPGTIPRFRKTQEVDLMVS